MINRIKEVITYSGLSERGFAIKCGLKPTTINNQLIGKREISLATIIAISSSFEEISAEWLLRGKGSMLLQKEETDLVLLVTEVAQEVSMQHSHQPHQIKMESELNELNLMLDPLYVRNVIRNLVENALKYSDDGVQIIIRISKKETQAIFTVKDNGWGIAPKYQKKIFTQFFQVPREQMAHQRGYGIGLASP